MKIEKIRIKNFKSIIDSGDIYLESDMTILAGKNESGKTNILEALEAFNKTIKFNFEYTSLLFPKQETIIAITFVLLREEVLWFSKRTKLLIENLPDFLKVTITKSNGQVYKIDEDSQIILGFNNSHFIYDDLVGVPNAINKQVEELNSIYEKATNAKLYFPVLKNGEKFLNYLRSHKRNSLPESLIKSRYLTTYNTIFSTIDGAASTYVSYILKWGVLIDMLPHFIFFKSFDNLLPDEFLIKDGLQNKIGQFVTKQLGLSVLTFITSDDRNKIKAKTKLNKELEGHYLKNWSQDKAYVQIEYDGEKATVWIIEDGEFFRPSQRSKGKQGHLSFFFSIEADFQEGNTNIILIDEPGFYLHAKAQVDIYNKLIEISKKGQIVFTTHSPYLMNSEEIHRIRLVKKENIEIGTIVDGGLIFKSDKETLTPIFTAIGIGLNQGIVSLDKKYNIVVEGLSDYFYLNIFKRVFNLENINFISGGGSGNMGNMGAILSGWGTEVLYLFDKDQGGEDGIKKLKKWSIDSQHILDVYAENQAIEDMFSKNDFLKYLIKDESIITDFSNSDYVKFHKIKKVIVSKQFYNKFNIQMSKKILKVIFML